MWCLSTKAPRSYCEAQYHDGCYLFFGKETKGLPESFLEDHRESCVRIPMRESIRSLNLLKLTLKLPLLLLNYVAVYVLLGSVPLLAV